MGNKIPVVTIIVIIVVIIIAGGYWFLTQKQYQPSTAPIVTQQQLSPKPTATTTNGTITIQNFSFNPETLTIKQGDTVTWINQDTTAHIIKSDTFNSADLGQDDQFQFTFNAKGTFSYTCSIHPYMSGSIIVQ